MLLVKQMKNSWVWKTAFLAIAAAGIQPIAYGQKDLESRRDIKLHGSLVVVLIVKEGVLIAADSRCVITSN